MNIVMFTNTFTPHVGGVAHSVAWLTEDLRRLGHRVLVVAPEYGITRNDEPDVLRVPAVQHFAGSDFSLPLPLARLLDDTLDAFQPDIVHSHHPFLLGTLALRVAAKFDRPVVYTYHTRYECYCHHVAPDAQAIQRLVLSLSFGYCDLCDAVIAPSASIARHLTDHGVKTPLSLIPTGVDLAFFAGGDGAKARASAGIPAYAFVVGHVGRLAAEKNLEFLAASVLLFLRSHEEAHFLVAGEGEMLTAIRNRFDAEGLADRVHLMGSVEGTALADTYAAMDLFAFSSKSETQGLVLAETMAAGTPVVALDAPGATEIVRDGENGRLVPQDSSPEAFARALEWVRTRQGEERAVLRQAALETAAPFSREHAATRIVDLYLSAIAGHPAPKEPDASRWQTAARRLDREWQIMSNMFHAIGDAVLAPDADRPGPRGSQNG